MGQRGQLSWVVASFVSQVRDSQGQTRYNEATRATRITREEVNEATTLN